MFKTRYLIRLDDACPTMNHEKWFRIEVLLDKYGVRPMVGVIPHNEDPKQYIDSEDEDFWKLVKAWENKGWAIAMHGYNHCYTSQEGMKGLNPMWTKSEFAGLSMDEQREKIRNGMAIMHEHGIIPRYFFAPSHTFDDVTLVALKVESDIRIISDCIAFNPYLERGFIFVPQIFGHCVNMPLSGVYTFCFHPNTMSSKEFAELDSFLSKYKNSFVKWKDLDLEKVKGKKWHDRLLSLLFFSYRKIRRMK